MRQRRIIDSPGSDVLFLSVIRKANEDVFLNGLRAGKSCLSEQAAIKGSCSATDIAAVVSGDNEMTRRMEVQRARRCSEGVRIEELMALVGMIERHARER